MLTNIEAKQSILAYGKMTLGPSRKPIMFSRDAKGELPTGLPPGFEYLSATLQVSVIEIEQQATYEKLVTVGFSLDTDRESECVTRPIGIWHKTKRGYKPLKARLQIEPQLVSVISDLLAEQEERLNSGVRVIKGRGREQRKIERLAEMCRFTDCRWERDSEGREIYVSYQHPDRDFNPYNNEFWVWEIIKRCSIEVSYKNGKQILTYPGHTETFTEPGYGHRAMREHMCDWLLSLKK